MILVAIAALLMLIVNVDLGSVEQSDRYALERAALDPSRELFFW